MEMEFQRVSYLGHSATPGGVNGAEEGAFLGHLLHDVGAREDGLQIQPRRLHRQPVIHHILTIQLEDVLEQYQPKIVTFNEKTSLFKRK
jgi:hypothetical protein